MVGGERKIFENMESLDSRSLEMAFSESSIPYTHKFW